MEMDMDQVEADGGVEGGRQNYYSSQDPVQGPAAGLELMVMWNSPTVGQDGIGCRLGPAGSFRWPEPRCPPLIFGVQQV
jgi:hypothetical protein